MKTGRQYGVRHATRFASGCLAACLTTPARADPITYQGQLKELGVPLSGPVDLAFSLWDAPGAGDPPSGGTQIGSTQIVSSVPIINGLFTVLLNDGDEFGSDAFNGSARWLQVEVDGTPLSPRQEVTASPYALKAKAASALDALDGNPKNAVFVANNGYVGIGTTSPSFPLTLQTPSNTFGFIHTDGARSLASYLTTGECRFGSLNNDSLAFMTLAVERMAITPDGNVGIGTTTPKQHLHVAGDYYGRGHLFLHAFEGDGSSGTAYVQARDDSATSNIDLRLRAKAAATPIDVMTLTSGGKIGIGTTTPHASFALQVKGVATPWEGGIAAGGDAASVVLGEVNGVATVGGHNATQSAWQNLSLNPVAGNVGIGTTTPTAKLDVVGTVKVTGLQMATGAGAGRVLTSDANGTASWQTGASSQWVSTSGNIYYNTGRVMIGTASYDDQYLLNVKSSNNPASNGGIKCGGDSFSVVLAERNGLPTIAGETYGERYPYALSLNPNGATVMIGTTSIPQDPSIKLFVNGTMRAGIVEITGADLAEKFPASEELQPGMVVAIDPEKPGHLRLSRTAYNRAVAGVVSGANDFSVGAVLGSAPGAENDPPIALTGRVYVWCDASTGPIEPADLLTTSDTPGHAMKAADHSRAQGAVLGKAMTGLKDGTGLVLVLVSLQ